MLLIDEILNVLFCDVLDREPFGGEEGFKVLFENLLIALIRRFRDGISDVFQPRSGERHKRGVRYNAAVLFFVAYLIQPVKRMSFILSSVIAVLYWKDLRK